MQLSYVIIFESVIVASYFQTACFAQTTCCGLESKCKMVPTLNITLKEFVKSSPLYEAVLSVSKQSHGTISTCNTYFPVTDTTYITFRRAIWEYEGKIESNTQIYIIADVPKRPGVLRIQGLYGEEGTDTAVINAYILDKACDSCEGVVFAAYACFLFDDCSYVNPPFDFLYGLSSTPNVSEACVSRLKSVFSRYNFSTSGFFEPAGSAIQCVTRYNGRDCVNADRVKRTNSISYPQQCPYS